MEQTPISHDDLTDVIEMTDKLEKYIHEVLDGNPHSLALSALMNATITCMIAECETVDQIVAFRNVFVRVLDESIQRIEIKKPEN